jgi:hypothetical protein
MYEQTERVVSARAVGWTCGTLLPVQRFNVVISDFESGLSMNAFEEKRIDYEDREMVEIMEVILDVI